LHDLKPGQVKTKKRLTPASPRNSEKRSTGSRRGGAEDRIDGLLRVGCGLNDQAVILLQLRNPFWM
jgi:hypothetical protein